MRKVRKIKKKLVKEEVLTVRKKTLETSPSASETSENVLLFVFISLLISFGVCSYIQYLSGSVQNQASNKKYLLELIKRRSKVH